MHLGLKLSVLFRCLTPNIAFPCILMFFFSRFGLFMLSSTFFFNFHLLLQAIPSYSARRSLFEHYVKTRAEEERKEKRAAQKAAIEGFKRLLDEASEVNITSF